MKQLFFLLILTSICSITKAQNEFKKNDIYIEAFGFGGFGSVNYERQLTKEPGLGARIGLGFYTENAFYVSIPVGLVYLFELKNPKSFIEAGMGITWFKEDGKFVGKYSEFYDNFSNFNISAGYRRHTKRNVMWRFSVGGLFNKNTTLPWAGIAIGKRF